MTSLDGRRQQAGASGPHRTPPAEDANGLAPGATEGPDDRSGSSGRLEVSGTSEEGAGPPAPPAGGTVRRSRPARGARPDATDPAVAVDPATAASAPPGNGEPVAVPDPPRRPVPPTFPSPGQPPPAVARRAGRHARPEPEGEHVHTPPDGYRPRHAAPDVETEKFPAVTSATGPGGSGPVPLLPSPPAEPAPAPRTPTPAAPVPRVPDAGGAVAVGPMTSPTPTGTDRVRVVLAERRVPTRAVRTVAEIEQQTETGELLLGNLLRAQLTLGLRLGAVAVLLLGALPLVFLAFPGLGETSVLGIRLPWLLLGLVPYPVMLVLAWLYARTAERNELDFADNVED